MERVHNSERLEDNGWFRFSDYLDFCPTAMLQSRLISEGIRTKRKKLCARQTEYLH